MNENEQYFTIVEKGIEPFLETIFDVGELAVPAGREFRNLFKNYIKSWHNHYANLEDDEGNTRQVKVYTIPVKELLEYYQKNIKGPFDSKICSLLEKQGFLSLGVNEGEITFETTEKAEDLYFSVLKKLGNKMHLLRMLEAEYPDLEKLLLISEIMQQQEEDDEDDYPNFE